MNIDREIYLKKLKGKIYFIVGIIIFIVALIYIISSINSKDGDILYSTTYYFAFGSKRVKIYTNGDVYEDLEIEEPNHKPNYKYLKTLSKTEKDNLIIFLESESNTDMIKNYVIELVYGVKEFDIYGGY